MTPQAGSRLASMLLFVGCLALVAFTAYVGYLVHMVVAFTAYVGYLVHMVTP